MSALAGLSRPGKRGHLQHACVGPALISSLQRVFALGATALFHRLRREPQKTQEQAEILLAKATEQGFSFWIAWGTMLRGWALAEQGWPEEGIVQLQKGLAAYRATGSQIGWALFLALFVEAHSAWGALRKHSRAR